MTVVAHELFPQAVSQNGNGDSKKGFQGAADNSGKEEEKAGAGNNCDNTGKQGAVQTWSLTVPNHNDT